MPLLTVPLWSREAISAPSYEKCRAILKVSRFTQGQRALQAYWVTMPTAVGRRTENGTMETNET